MTERDQNGINCYYSEPFWLIYKIGLHLVGWLHPDILFISKWGKIIFHSYFVMIRLLFLVPCYLISSSIWYCFSNKQLAILELLAIAHTSIRLSEIIITAPKKNRPVNFFVAVFGPAANYSIIIIFPSSIYIYCKWQMPS